MKIVGIIEAMTIDNKVMLKVRGIIIVAMRIVTLVCCHIINKY